MKTIATIILLIIINNIFSGPIIGEAACNACCIAVHSPEFLLWPIYVTMVAKCVTACLTALVPGLPPAPSDPRDLPCLIAQNLIMYAPSV